MQVNEFINGKWGTFVINVTSKFHLLLLCLETPENRQEGGIKRTPAQSC